jgi:hypothetical protein
MKAKKLISLLLTVTLALGATLSTNMFTVSAAEGDVAQDAGGEIGAEIESSEIEIPDNWDLVKEWDFTDPAVDMSQIMACGNATIELVKPTSTSPQALVVSGVAVPFDDGLLIKNPDEFTSFDTSKSYGMYILGKMGSDKTEIGLTETQLFVYYETLDPVNGKVLRSQYRPFSVTYNEEFKMITPFGSHTYDSYDWPTNFKIIPMITYGAALSYELYNVSIFEIIDNNTDTEPPKYPKLLPGETRSMVWDFTNPDVDMTLVSASGDASIELTSANPSSLVVSNVRAGSYDGTNSRDPDGIIFKNVADFSMFDGHNIFNMRIEGKMGSDE